MGGGHRDKNERIDRTGTICVGQVGQVHDKVTNMITYTICTCVYTHTHARTHEHTPFFKELFSDIDTLALA